MPIAYSPREMLARLVAFPTVSSRSNLDLVEFVEAYLAAHGVTAVRVPDATGEKASLFACIGPEAAGGVVLSGHSDVVPVDGQDWTSDPFVLSEREGRLHGRGTCDMKGFVATALALVPQMLAAGLRRPVILAISHDEEIGCRAAPPLIAAMLDALPRPEAVIVGEPSQMRVVTGHKGSWGFHIDVRGHEVHSSLIHRGVSAVMVASRMVAWMAETTAANLAAGRGEFDPSCTTLHVGMISGGTAHNITARDCRLSGEVRVLPGESVDAWQGRVEAEAARLEAEARAINPVARITVATRMRIPELAPEADGAAERLARALTGDNGAHVVSYQTEAGHFQARGLSTVVCGPGSIAQAHQPDEFITVAQLDAGEGFMRRLAARLAA